MPEGLLRAVGRDRKTGLLLLQHTVWLRIDLLGRQVVHQLSLGCGVRESFVHEWLPGIPAVENLLFKRAAKLV